MRWQEPDLHTAHFEPKFPSYPHLTGHTLHREFCMQPSRLPKPAPNQLHFRSHHYPKKALTCHARQQPTTQNTANHTTFAKGVTQKRGRRPPMRHATKDLHFWVRCATKIFCWFGLGGWSDLTAASGIAERRSKECCFTSVLCRVGCEVCLFIQLEPVVD